MFSWSEAYSNKVGLPGQGCHIYPLSDFTKLTYAILSTTSCNIYFPTLLAPVHLGLYDLHVKLAGGFLVSAMIFGGVWAVVSPAQPYQFGVWGRAEVAWRGRCDLY